MSEWVPTPESSHVKQIRYEIDTQDLYVEFDNGQVYRYYDVPERVWNEFLDHPSKGRYVNVVLARRYRNHES